MSDATKEIHSLSDFKRKTGELLARMKETGNPVVLTIKGKEELVVQDAASYRRLVELAERTEMQEFLKQSKADADAGRTLPAREFVESLGREA
jgi:prevent-host-death family protein